MKPQSQSLVRIKVGEISLDGDLTLPKDAKGIVLFAHVLFSVSLFGLDGLLKLSTKTVY